MRFLVLLAFLIAPSSAAAATISARESCDKSYCDISVEYTAAPGEANQLTVTLDGAFTDVVPIQVGKGCSAIAGGARCAGATSITVQLGDGDDVATLTGSEIAYGGAGNDRITGGRHLSGGPGADELISTGGTTFQDDDGPQVAPDRYVGAAGTDTVSYEGRATGVDVDLRRTANAGDTFTSIEQVKGGAGDDRLTGTEGPNHLDGGLGTDRLIGLGGNDFLVGEVVSGGPGDDYLSGIVRADCGDGSDEVSIEPREFGLVRFGCERVTVGSHPEVTLRAGPGFLSRRECHCRSARYVATVAGAVVARASLPHRRVAREDGRLALRLNARGRKLLAERGRLRVTVRLVEIYEAGISRARERVRIELLG